MALNVSSRPTIKRFGDFTRHPAIVLLFFEVLVSSSKSDRLNTHFVCFKKIGSREASYLDKKYMYKIPQQLYQSTHHKKIHI